MRNVPTLTQECTTKLRGKIASSRLVNSWNIMLKEYYKITLYNGKCLILKKYRVKTDDDFVFVKSLNASTPACQ